MDEFIAEVRAFLDANARRRPDPHEAAAWGVGDDTIAYFSTDPPDVDRANAEKARQWQHRRFDAGLGWITGPVEYGGRGLTTAHDLLYDAIEAEYDVPDTGVLAVIGLGMIGPTILAHAQPHIRQRYLPAMYAGETIACQLFSEPGAGSDLASLSTRAEKDEAANEWVLNGQKVWTSGAQHSHFGAIIARTDPTVPKHNGITMFIVDMHAPGVTVRPLKVATGASPFNEVFFDNVRLPADAVINKVNNGWAAAVVMLRNERVTIGTAAPARTSPLAYDSLSKLAATLGRDDQGTARALAGLYARERASGLFGQVLREEAMSGRDPGARGSEAKLAGAVLGLHAAEVALGVLGPAAAGSTSEDVRTVITAIIGVPAGSIAGGSNEIQRNIIGERVLGLPKDPGVDRSIPFNQLAVGTQKR
ncbi:MAG TPA: acyl-CoA dehydrogenase family protein [Streptosporangiaceae bacterium]